VYPADGPSTSTATRIGFAVESVSTIVETITAIGGSVAAAPRQSPWGYRAVIVDPDGHHIELVQALASE
jgi:predicted enzyme related to lactoylglutathione lyase